MIPVTYGYARVSKIAEEGKNLETQLHLLQEYGIRDEMIFRDVGTGRKQEREGWQKLMGQVRAGDTIVVCWLDRMSRDFDNSVAVQSELEDMDVGIISIMQDIDTRRDTTAGQRFFRRVLMAGGAHEIEVTSEKIKAGLKRAKASGKNVGRPKALSDEQVVVAHRLWSQENASWRYLAKVFECHRTTIKTAVLNLDESMRQEETYASPNP